MDWIEEKRLDTYHLAFNHSSGAFELFQKRLQLLPWDKKKEYVNLLVYNKNPKAVAYYIKYGEIEPKILIKNPTRIAQNYISTHNPTLKIPVLEYMKSTNREHVEKIIKDIQETPSTAEDISVFSSNPKAVDFLLQRTDLIQWSEFSANPNPVSVEYLRKHPEKIDWYSLSGNRSAIDLIEQNLNRIDWKVLSSNPSALHILELHREKIDYKKLSMNPGIFISSKRVFKILRETTRIN